MGLTHYFNLVPNKNRASYTKQRYLVALRQCQRIAKFYNAQLKATDKKHPDRLSGYSVHTAVGSYSGLEINGTKDLGHEDFCLPEDLKEYSDFCKTNGKPYDIVVRACLLVLKHYLGPVFEYSSDDTNPDQWYRAQALVFDALPKVDVIEMPDFIKPTKLKVV